MEIPVPGGRNSHLGARVCISVSDLEHQDTKDLGLRRLRDARRDRSHDGNVPFSLVMIILNVAAFGPGLFREEAKRIRLQPETAGA